ncbi:MAG: hypothetical protein ABII01_06415 [Candidatus Woesearchaeota archaeon]
MEIISIILIIGGIFVLFLILGFLFRKYFSAFFLDGVDLVLSFVDEFFGGALMLDWGDWIAAIIIFAKERKITNWWLAVIVAMEAANFIPGLDYITNFFPAVTIVRFACNKYRTVEKKKKKIEEDISLAEKAGIDVKKEKHELEEINKLIEKENPVDALKKAKRSEQEISEKLIEFVDNIISSVKGMIQKIADQDIYASPEAVQVLQHGVDQCMDLLRMAKQANDDKDFNSALNDAMSAKGIITHSVERFNSYVE